MQIPNDAGTLRHFLPHPPGQIAHSFLAAARLAHRQTSWLYDRCRDGTLAFVRLSPGRNIILDDDLARLLDPGHPRDGRDTLHSALLDRPTLSVSEIADTLGVHRDTLGVHRDTIDRLIQREELPAYRGTHLVRRDDLVAFLADRRTPTIWE